MFLTNIWNLSPVFTIILGFVLYYMTLKRLRGVRGLTENIIVNKTHWQPIVSSTIFFHAAMLTHCMLWWGRGGIRLQAGGKKTFFLLTSQQAACLPWVSWNPCYLLRWHKSQYRKGVNQVEKSKKGI